MLESNKKSINYDMLYFDENPYYSDMITDYERNMAVTSFLIIIVAVITSYSIHYTKLYDRMSLIRCSWIGDSWVNEF